MNFFTVPTWVWMFLITTVIVGLVKYAWFEQRRRIQDLEACKLELNKRGGPLTVLGHQEICSKLTKERDQERGQEMTESMQNLKEWLGLRLDGMQKDIKNLSENMEDKVENKILKELQKLNRSN